MPPETAGWRLDRALAATLPTLSRERLKKLIAAGHVCLARAVGDERAIRDPATKVAGGEIFAVSVPDPRPAHNEAQAIALDIAFEDEHLIVVDKPAGLVVHPAAGNLDGTLVNALLHHCRGSLSGIGGVERPGIVHRIDKDTSGLIVAAKTDRTHVGLAEQFALHTVDRRYLAIVAGRPASQSGTIEGWLGRSAADRKKMAVLAPRTDKLAYGRDKDAAGTNEAAAGTNEAAAGRGKYAVTHYRTIQPLDGAAFVECRLETGRTHQVRVHMASIGHPLLGDPVYGRARGAHRELLAGLIFERQALHAARLGFVHPVTKAALAFESKIPPDMQRLFTELLLEG